MTDLKQYGVDGDLAFYWIREYGQFGEGHCILIAIDELGNVTRTGGRRALDEDAPTEAAAILEHLSPAFNQADSHLERRKRRLDEEGREAPEKKRLVDPATARFFSDSDW